VLAGRTEDKGCKGTVSGKATAGSEYKKKKKRPGLLTKDQRQRVMGKCKSLYINVLIFCSRKLLLYRVGSASKP